MAVAEQQSTSDLETVINQAWDDRDSVGTDTQGAVRAAVNEALDGLDSGLFRVAEKREGGWHVNEWLKKAVLLYFRLNPMEVMSGSAEDSQSSASRPRPYQ